MTAPRSPGKEEDLWLGHLARGTLGQVAQVPKSHVITGAGFEPANLYDPETSLISHPLRFLQLTTDHLAHHVLQFVRNNLSFTLAMQFLASHSSRFQMATGSVQWGRRCIRQWSRPNFAICESHKQSLRSKSHPSRLLIPLIAGSSSPSKSHDLASAGS